MQNIGVKSDEHGNQKPFYGMVVYQRMTDNELAKMKKAYDYDANFDFTGAVPDDCKFRVSASFGEPTTELFQTDMSYTATIRARRRLS